MGHVGNAAGASQNAKRDRRPTLDRGGEHVRTPEMRAKFQSFGVEAVGNSSAEATAFLRNEIERNGKIIREVKITVQD
jgi:hypothetical protein